MDVVSLKASHLDRLAAVGITCSQSIESILRLWQVANDTTSFFDFFCLPTCTLSEPDLCDLSSLFCMSLFLRQLERALATYMSLIEECNALCSASL